MTDFIGQQGKEEYVMNRFLVKDKDSRIYKGKISGEPKETQRNKQYSVNVFNDFVREEYSGKTVEDVVCTVRFKINCTSKTTKLARSWRIDKDSFWNYKISTQTKQD